MNDVVSLSRPGKWAKAKRVAFIAHALLPDYLSTELIDARLTELGRGWPGDGENPGFIKWLQFPVIPPEGSGMEPVWVDFYIIPVLAPQFLASAMNGQAYDWSERVALTAIHEAKRDGVPITVGWGAMTKVATRHGTDFLNRNDGEEVPHFTSTHGDAGTAALVLQAAELAGFKPGFRVAILGANGAIGDVIARAITTLKPESILLVGKKDKPGESKKLDRLEELQHRAESCIPDGHRTEVQVHQGVKNACSTHASDLVIVATTGMDLAPKEVPIGAVVLDMTTPSACSPHPDWDKRLVLTCGCGEFDPSVVPYGFGRISGQVVHDLGMSNHAIWGCTGETIARASAGWDGGHISGTPIPIIEVAWAKASFQKLGFHTQPALTFGERVEWKNVQRFVANPRDTSNRVVRVMKALSDLAKAATY